MRAGAKLIVFGLPGLAVLVASYSVLTIAGSGRNGFEELQVASRQISTNEQSVCEQVDRIAALGTVEPAGGVVDVGVASSGIVQEIFVAAGSSVHRGDPLFRLDDRSARAKLALRQSELALAQAKLAERQRERVELMEETKIARASLAATKAELAHAEQLTEMADRLKDASIISVKERRKRQFVMTRAAARVREVEARLKKALIRYANLDPERGGRAIAVNMAEVARVQAMLEIARIGLELLTIKAPSGGKVLQVNIRPGQVVEPGSKSPLRMGMQSRFHVRVEIDEMDLPRFSSGLPAMARRRAKGVRDINLKFDHLEPIVMPKIAVADRLGERVDSRVLKVIYGVEEIRLFPGELLDVFIGKPCREPGHQTPRLAQDQTTHLRSHEN